MPVIRDKRTGVTQVQERAKQWELTNPRDDAGASAPIMVQGEESKLHSRSLFLEPARIQCPRESK